jgi:phosphatidylglycerophosphate synthase
MPLYLRLIGNSPLRLWGLDSRQRLQRLLPNAELADDPGNPPDSARVLLVRGDYLFDPRVIRALAGGKPTLLQLPPEQDSLLVAALVPAGMAEAVGEGIARGVEDSGPPGGIPVITPDQLCPPYQAQLLKAQPAFVLPLREDNRRQLEGLLFGAAYKGITDLVTKWVWPVPAQWGVRACVRLGISPNQVTALSWLLAIAAGLLFWQGQFGWGLLLGWFMTYLDTVDGKLARVTVTSSPFGHLFDHILDLVHPPLWYLAWGLGLASYQPLLLPPALAPAIWLIFGGYIGGRLVEGAFQIWLGRFGIFCWRRIDSFSRLITARRNPCLLLLSLGAIAGRPDLGLEAVALWTGVSTLFLLLRLGQAGFTRLVSGPLTSWLAEIRRDPPDRSLAVRWFAGG